MEIGQAQEDYLEVIYCLSRERECVKCIHIANYMGRSKPSVTIAVQGLEKKGYLKKGDHSVLLLTEKGLALAEKLYERHHYFMEVLIRAGVDREIAEKDACSMEHVLSEESYQKLKLLLDVSQST